MILIWLIAAALFVSFGLVVLRGAPYVPSHQREVDRALTELYPLSAADTLVDIGSGDGRVLRTAARHGAHALGYELNPFLVAISRWMSHGQPLVRVKAADAWLATLPDETTVVYVFAVSRDLPRLVKKLQAHATRTDHSLTLVCYGAQPALPPQALLGAHGRYEIAPLQSSEA